MSIFSRSCIMGQNIISNFVSGSKDERRNIIEGALGLEKFNLYLEEARKWRQEKESEIEKEDILLKNFQKQMESLTKKKGAFGKPETIFKELEKREKEKEKTIQKFDQSAEMIKEKISKTIEQIESSEFKSQKFEEMTNKIDEPDRFLSQISEKRNFLVGMKEEPLQICPSCGQPISQVHIEKISKEVEDLIALVCPQLEEAVPSPKKHPFDYIPG